MARFTTDGASTSAAHRASALFLAKAVSQVRRFPLASIHQTKPATTAAATSSQGHHGVLDPAGCGAAELEPGDAVAVALGEELVGVGVVSVGVGVGVADVSVGVGVGVGVGVVSVGVGVGVGEVLVALAEAVRLGVVVPVAVAVSVAVGVGVGLVGVGVLGVRLGTDGVVVIEGRVRLGFAVGSVTLPEPHAVNMSAAPATSTAAPVRRTAMMGPPRSARPVRDHATRLAIVVGDTVHPVGGTQSVRARTTV